MTEIVRLQNQLSDAHRLITKLRGIIQRRRFVVSDETQDASRFRALQDMPAEKAQAFFWNYSSRKERARAIDKYIEQEETK